MTAPTYQLSPEQREIYRRFADLALPRHTSYPIAPVWRDDFSPTSYRRELERLGEAGEALSLYVHVPYCERLCYYCACTKEIIAPSVRQMRDPVPALLEGIRHEADLIGQYVRNGEVKAMHWGGGSPTFLSSPDLRALHDIFKSRFHFAADAEQAIEIDPRITTAEQLSTLRSLGFNRISLGIQDFDPAVQAAVNRIQPLETVERVITECRALGFSSINFDLIYGLPFQTLDSLRSTLDHTIRLNPDRIAFYRLALIPEIFRWQRTFVAEDLPTGEVSLDLNLLAINRLREAGYRFIGLDHFAKPAEGLSLAAREGELQRNFQGMTTHGSLSIVGFGPSAITQTGGCFVQSQKTTEEWLTALKSDLPVRRGLELSLDDQIRRELLQQLYGHGAIQKALSEEKFKINFDAYFRDELSRLRVLQDLGMIRLSASAIELTEPLGRLLSRVTASVFDKHLPPDAYLKGLPANLASKVG